MLELKAGLFTLRSFSEELSITHVKLNMDNTAAVSNLRNMGGPRSRKCNALAHTIWDFCPKHHIWLTVAHLPDHLNVLADEKCRVYNWSMTILYIYDSGYRLVCLSFICSTKVWLGINCKLSAVIETNLFYIPETQL